MSTKASRPLGLADRLHELTCRAIALELAVIGASREAALNSYGDGLAQLARDLSSGLEQFEQEFRDEFCPNDPNQKPETHPHHTKEANKMRRLLAALLIASSIAGCAHHPTQADLEYKAFDQLLSEKVASGKISPAEADLARQQYAGALRTRESNIAASYGVANSNNAYARNSTAAMGFALMCAGQGYRNC